MLPLFALNETGYKRIIELSSLSFLTNDELNDPHLNIEELFKKSDGVCLFSGSIFGLIGKLFDKGKFSEITELYSKFKSVYEDRFYIEIQRHGDLNFHFAVTLDLNFLNQFYQI